ncbi:MAG TPA: bidirectional hydrogenase complex protein HoxU [Chthoniobacteraceae bacterium]|jgi:bidirectional [NiFe] hydrogenase diaphorase subunit|nr:bidirectional hydrogenase complex protein HoxU [Chthoniobacteraceae bacterium]
MAVKTLTIDGKPLSADESETILQAAADAGVRIPTLCHLEGLGDIGACRLCIVEIAGSNKLLPACVTKVAEGMEVLTDTPRLRKYRLMTLELLFAERNHVCAVCVANGHCELQDLAAEHGMTHVRFPYLYPNATVDASHDFFVLDHNRCVLCTRCVRVCDEVEGAHTWDVMGRGAKSRVITDLNEPWGESDTCTKCGKCVQVCPTGALSSKGKSVGEMVKRQAFLPFLTQMREAR